MKLSLVVLAAGKGSRFGGPKQLTPVGAAGETITHYNVYDAISAGFDNFVFVVREELKDSFHKEVARVVGHQAQTHVVCQDHNLPYQTLPTGLWGTTHAVLQAEGYVSDAFAVINADDYYGPDTFAQLAAFFNSPAEEARCALIGYPVARTLSAHGPVTRAWCRIDERHRLRSLRELRDVQTVGNHIGYADNGGEGEKRLPASALVSMNCWGLRASLFPSFQQSFREFEHEAVSSSIKECLLPETMHTLIAAGQTQVQVIKTGSTWFGLTFSDDLPAARKAVNKLTQAGSYPSPLFGT